MEVDNLLTSWELLLTWRKVWTKWNFDIQARRQLVGEGTIRVLFSEVHRTRKGRSETRRKLSFLIFTYSLKSKINLPQQLVFNHLHNVQSKHVPRRRRLLFFERQHAAVSELR